MISPPLSKANVPFFKRGATQSLEFAARELAGSRRLVGHEPAFFPPQRSAKIAA